MKSPWLYELSSDAVDSAERLFVDNNDCLIFDRQEITKLPPNVAQAIRHVLNGVHEADGAIAEREETVGIKEFEVINTNNSVKMRVKARTQKEAIHLCEDENFGFKPYNLKCRSIADTGDGK